MNLCLWNKLPKSLIDHIYGFDSTFKSKMNDSLNLIKHFTPTCSCDGGVKNRYRHHYQLEPFGVPVWSWEWRRRNACPMHNPGDFDKDGNQTQIDWTNMSGVENTHRTVYYLNDITTGFDDDVNYITINRTIDYDWSRHLGYFMFCFHKSIHPTSMIRKTSKHYNFKYPSPIKTYSRKKLCGARFMDMTADQRQVVA